MTVQRYSWLFAGYRPRLLNKVMSTNQSHANYNTSLRTPSRDGPKVTMCVTVIIVRLPVLQLIAFRRRGCRPVGLTSLMATLRTTNEPKPRYAGFFSSLLGRPVEAIRCRSSNSRIRIFPKFARQMKLKMSKYFLHTLDYNTHCIAAPSSHRIASLVTNIPRRPVSFLATNLSEPQLSRNVSLRDSRIYKREQLI